MSVRLQSRHNQCLTYRSPIKCKGLTLTTLIVSVSATWHVCNIVLNKNNFLFSKGILCEVFQWCCEFFNYGSPSVVVIVIIYLYRSSMRILYPIQWRIQDFPEGGRGPPTWVLFGKNVCENERIWSCGGGGGRAPGTPPPRSANAIQHCASSNLNFSVFHGYSHSV